MKKFFRLVAVAIFFSSFMPTAYAADLEVAGWIPYWRASQGAADARKHLDVIDSVHPFGFTVKSDGTLNDLADIKSSAWKRLFRDARREDVLITPSVNTSNGSLVHTLLSDASLRKKHIREIVKMVDRGNFDGVNINYEGKLSATKDYFSLFLKELKKALKGKLLTCAIESRTPPQDLYRTVPADLQYANDLVEIAKHCDRVEIMTYDQQRADLSLNDARKGTPYIPVSDAAWARKVINYMDEWIPKDKMMLGIPTYGHEYEIIVSPNWYQEYGRIRALNPDVAIALARKKKVTPSRNSGGEMGFTYWSLSPSKMQTSMSVPVGTSKGDKAAAQALAYANQTGQSVAVNVVVWSDAKAIEEKIQLAEELGIAGVAIFKFDGEEDDDMWDIFEE